MRILNRPIVIVKREHHILNLHDICDLFPEKPEDHFPIFIYYNDRDHYDALIMEENNNSQDIFLQLLRLQERLPNIISAPNQQNSSGSKEENETNHTYSC